MPKSEPRPKFFKLKYGSAWQRFSNWLDDKYRTVKTAAEATKLTNGFQIWKKEDVEAYGFDDLPPEK